MTVKLLRLMNAGYKYHKQPLATGELIREPEPGKSVIIGAGLYGAHTTQKVLEVMPLPTGWQFQTENGMYEIEIMEK